MSRTPHASSLVQALFSVSLALAVAGCNGGTVAPGDGGGSGNGGSTGSGGSSAGGATGSGGGGGSGGSTGSGGGGGSGGLTGQGGQGGSGGATGQGGSGGAVGQGGSGGVAPDAGVDAGRGGSGGTGGAGGARVDAGVDVRPDAAAGGTGGGGAGGTGGTGAGGTGGAVSCSTPPPASPLVGWASQNGGTTGGGTTAPTVVTTAAQFTTAIGGTAARVIHVMGSFSGSFGIGSNKTVIGLCGARITGHIGVSGSTNVIVRNLTIVGNNCTDSPSDCSAGADAVGISNNARNVWFDHCDVSDGSDGNLDINAGSDFVTISWTKFSYSSRRTDPLAGASGHRFSNLVGSADTVTTDATHLNVTFHHNWWAQNVDQRMPRTRFGDIHVFNNLYTATGNSYCTNAGIQTHVLVENNAYIGVNNPLSPDANGDMLERGNLFTNVTGNRADSANPVGFVPPYAYTLDATGGLQAAIMAGAGPR